MSTTIIVPDNAGNPPETKESNEWQAETIRLAESNGKLQQTVESQQAELAELTMRLASLETQQAETQAQASRLAISLMEMETEAETEADELDELDETELTIVEIPPADTTPATPETLPEKPKRSWFKMLILGKPRNHDGSTQSE